MSGEIVKEWHFWLVSIATGAFLAFSYDVLRLFRRLVRHGRFAVDLEDILYWTACFGLSFTLLYYGNNGVIRFAAVFGAAVGMFVYAVTVGRFFVRVSYLVIDKTIGSLFRFFITLFQKIRLTCTRNRHKMKIHSQKHHRKKEKDGKGETTDGRKNKDKKGKAKDTGVSPRQEREPSGDDDCPACHSDYDRRCRH